MKQNDLLDTAAASTAKELETAQACIRSLRADLAGQVRQTEELRSQVEYLKQTIVERDRALGAAQGLIKLRNMKENISTCPACHSARFKQLFPVNHCECLDCGQKFVI